MQLCSGMHFAVSVALGLPWHTQQYKWLEQLYPTLFERVKAKILEGKFHPVGGSWVENDGNMPSGEGLARQFIFGQRYFQSRFGIRCKTAWLPDSFGITGALPQLVRLAGMDYFFTQKLSWCVLNGNLSCVVILIESSWAGTICMSV